MPTKKDLPVVPSLSCDSHMHVLGAIERYPAAPNRLYTPTVMPLESYQRVATGLGLQRVVFVQPSAYGTDNRCMMDALQRCPGFARGVVVIETAISDNELHAMHEAGVRGIRLNLMTPRIEDAATAERLLGEAVARIKKFGWHIQIYADPTIVADIAPIIRKVEVPVVLDHMAGARADRGIEDRDFVALLDLLREGLCWVKVSGADILTCRDDGFAGPAAPFVRALIEANSRQVVWGTDWPHLVHHAGASGDAAPLAGYRPVNESESLWLLRDCADDEEFSRVLVENPAALYGF
jgi:predicted TIM-barrel fold metal-dependent hydrolase